MHLTENQGACVTNKRTVSINFELDPDANKGLERDSKRHGRSKKQEARCVLNAWYLMPEVERKKWMQQVNLSAD